MTSPKKYRFFYHYRKAANAMSVHWRNKCQLAKNIVCNVPTETKWNSDQPHLVIQGYATSINWDENGVATIL
jgi:hypothetical protein